MHTPGGCWGGRRGGRQGNKITFCGFSNLLPGKFLDPIGQLAFADPMGTCKS